MKVGWICEAALQIHPQTAFPKFPAGVQSGLWGLTPGPDSGDGQARRRNRLGLGHDHGDDTILIRDLGLGHIDVMR